MKKLNLNLTIVLLITVFISQVKAIAIDSPELNLLENQEILNLSELKEVNLNIGQLYDTQQYDKIIPLFLAKIQTYETENNLIGQMKTWRDLASIYDKLGQLDQALSSVEKSLNLWQNLPKDQETQILLAQILDIQGQIELSSGQGEKALNSWSNSAKIYHDNNKITEFTKAKLNQVQALRTLGFYNQAIKTLMEINEKIEKESDSFLKAQSLQILGEVWQKVGQLEKAQLTLEKALEITRNEETYQDLTATILISLGQIFELQGQEKEALNLYQEALNYSNNLDITTKAKLYQLNIEKQPREALILIDEIETNLNQLPVNHNNLYRRINLANHLMELDQNPQVLQHLTITIQQAQRIGDQRAEAYALGNLGKLYEKNQRYSEAYELTQKALIIAQRIKAPDLAYQWQWQIRTYFNNTGSS
jgi:tetratricopeptide (TPR) repeat protein